MEISRLWGRPWAALVEEYSEAELMGWYRVHLDPTGRAGEAKKPKVRGSAG